MFAEGVAVDFASVAERVNAAERPDALAELEAVAAIPPQPFHVETHCKNILRRSLRRRLAETGATLTADADKPSANPEKLAAATVSHLSALLVSIKGETSTPELVGEIADDWRDRADGKRERRGVQLPTFQATRALWLDPGLHVLAAKTSAGKSVFEGAVARHAALQGKRVLRCFLDMGRRDLIARDLAALMFLPLRDLDKGVMLEDQRAVLPLAREAWRHGLDVETLTAPTLPLILSRARALLADRGLDLITIDFAQNVNTGNPSFDASGNANARIGEVTKALKLFAIEAGVPVLLLSQLNRGDRDETRTPILSDLRDSGNLEQDARSVCFLSPELKTANRWATEQGAQSWRDLNLRPVCLTVAKNQQGKAGGFVALRMLCDRFSIEDAGFVKDSVLWNAPDKERTGYPRPVIARDALGHCVALDPRFLPHLNAAADKEGKPTFEAVETVAGGLAAVAERLAAYRQRKEG